MANPQYSYQSTSQAQANTNPTEYTSHGQWTKHDAQDQYTEINRRRSTNDSNTETQTPGSFASYLANNTESMTPMDRLFAESSQQAPWNSIGSVGSSSSKTGVGNSDRYANHQQQTGDNWSMCGNQSAK